ncbi:hypothetical protein HRH59_12420 [Rheinheimera sp. YQF-2]|uniref:Uncharacterized protein n=1 Tax=Rheinheimera lutimaris TaxID=2740584 RepID=A0A7Y5EIB2_9GAMM|nr:hypothetical protein [Rheinheimera lutimaris]NRQ43350.1 hypothetical protein [Rheinheimera lutimaris]
MESTENLSNNNASSNFLDIPDLVKRLEAGLIDSDQLSINQCISIYKAFCSSIEQIKNSFKNKKHDFNLITTMDSIYQLKSAAIKYKNILNQSEIDLSDQNTKNIIGDPEEIYGSLTALTEEITNSLDLSDIERSLASFSNSNNPGIHILERKIIGAMSEQNFKLREKIEEESRRVFELNKTVSELNEKIEAELEKVSSYSEEKLIEIESNVEYLNKLSISVAVDQVTQKHSLRANEEKEHATFLRAVALGCLGVSAGIVLLSLIGVLDTFDWKDVTLKYGAIFFFTIPFAYLAKESNKHREAQRKYEDFDLSYSAVSGFIQSMNKEERLKLQTDLARQMLVRNEQPEKPINLKSHNENNNSDTLDLTSKILDLINRFDQKKS